MTEAALLACPRCRATFAELGAVDNSDGDPSHGALTVCVRCLAPLRFTVGLLLAPVSDAELASLDPGRRASVRIAQDALRPMVSMLAGRRDKGRLPE
jgi:hypothetical protein